MWFVPGRTSGLLRPGFSEVVLVSFKLGEVAPSVTINEVNKSRRVESKPKK